MMAKYYWYADIKPNRVPRYGFGVSGHVKRSSSPPNNQYPYLIEIINGSKHIVKSSDGSQVFTMDDNEEVDEINKINTRIQHEVIELADTTLQKISKEKAEKEIENYGSSRNRFGFQSDGDTIYLPSGEMDISSFRRKKRIHARLIRKPTPKKRIIKKKK